MSTHDITTLEQLHDFAAEFAASLKGGELIGLIGELGAGKTTFVQTVARELGIKNTVRSPTFILMQVFDVPGKTGSKLRRLCHVDAYRFAQEEELYTIGFADYAGKPDTVCLVEWADLTHFLGDFLGYQTLKFELSADGKRSVIWDKK